jgi:hypothetical protein
VRFADLDGDGKVDFIYLDRAGKATAYLNGGACAACENGWSVSYLDPRVIVSWHALADPQLGCSGLGQVSLLTALVRAVRMCTLLVC